jgi:hypothetical protein
MPTIADLKQSKFLTKADVTPPVLVTVAGYEKQIVGSGDEQEERWTLNFSELEKPFVLNSTNGQIIAQITGSDDFQNWVGKKIVLYFEPNVSYGGKLTGGIRVRAPKNQPAPAPAPSDNDGGPGF